MTIKEFIWNLTPPIMIKLFRKLWKKNNSVISETVIYEKIGNNEVSSSKISISEQKIKELNIDCVKISSYQNWNNTELTEKKLFQFSSFDVKSPFNKYEVEISFNNYGSWTVEVDYIKRNEILDKDYYFFPITADEYNITFGLSTVSAILFITDLWNISSRYRPTICAIDRNFLNYNVLPENIYPFALASKEELFDYFSTPHYSQRFIEYIGILYRLNPKSKFHVYFTDHQVRYVLSFFYANGISDSNLDVHLLTDGVGSFIGFNNIFNNQSAFNNYQQIKKSWILSKTRSIETGIQKIGSESFFREGVIPLCNDNLWYDFAYAYVTSIEYHNFHWYLLCNIDQLKWENVALKQNEKIEKVDLIARLQNLRKLQGSYILKSLMNYTDSLFDKDNDRKKLLILGTYVGSSEINPRFEIYLQKIIEKFGNKYELYYKGHPQILNDARTDELLKNNKIISLDKQIPTELIMLFNPDMYICGYLSSAYISLDLLNNDENHFLALFDYDADYLKNTVGILKTPEIYMYFKNNKFHMDCDFVDA